MFMFWINLSESVSFLFDDDWFDFVGERVAAVGVGVGVDVLSFEFDDDNMGVFDK